jgi:hypothetical protein
MPINLVSCTEVNAPALLELPAIELDERGLLEDEATLEGTEELDLIALELLATLELLTAIELSDELETGQEAPPTTP